MAGRTDLKHRLVTRFQRHLANSVSYTHRRVGSSFWLVSEFGHRSQYVRNIQADPRVRVRIAGHWHRGTAHLLPDDDPVARLRSLPRFNSAAVKAFGTDLLTVRVDLED